MLQLAAVGDDFMDGIRVLIVDDSLFFRTGVERELSVRLPKGSQFQLAANAYDARDKILSFDPDIMILDAEMPGMNGIKTLELIRKREDGKDLPVIFLTASSDRDTVVKAGLLKAANYIKKPFLPQDLVDRVNGVLADKLLDDPAITGILDNLGSLSPKKG